MENNINFTPFSRENYYWFTPFSREKCSGNLKVDTYKLKSIHSKVEMYTDLSNT